MRFEVEHAELPGGPRLPYVEQGDPEGVPVVFLHGYADSWRSYERVLADLPATIHAFAVTQRGHGDADRPASGYGLEDFSADVEAFLDAVGLDAAVLVADSSGTYVAQRFAVDHPGRVRGLVLASAVRSFRANPGEGELSRAILALEDPIDPAFVREFQRSVVLNPISPTFVEMLLGESLKMPARVWKAVFAGLLDADPPSEAGTITAPTVIVWGDHDEFLPRSDQEALAAAIPGSRLATYRDTGHLVHWERPERVAAEVLAMVERIRPGK